MTTWKQEVAEATVPLEGVNAITASMVWNIQTETDRTSAVIPKTATPMRGVLAVKSLREIDRRLIDGSNYLAGDMVTAAAYRTYADLWKTNESSLENTRVLNRNWGIEPGTDYLEINSEKWKIVRVSGAGVMDDEESGKPEAAKLIFYLRKENAAYGS